VVNDFGGAATARRFVTPAEAVVEGNQEAGASDGRWRRRVELRAGQGDGREACGNGQGRHALRQSGSRDNLAKMEVADFAKVLDVHLTGTFYCCKRVDGCASAITAASRHHVASGLYGNFGQAIMARQNRHDRLMNVLADRRPKTNIASHDPPTAATRMTEELLPPGAGVMKPESITPAVCSAGQTTTRTIMARAPAPSR